MIVDLAQNPAAFRSALRDWLAGVLAGLAVSTKVTYGVVGAAVLLAWWLHARSAVGMAELPFGIPVEIEAIVEI